MIIPGEYITLTDAETELLEELTGDERRAFLLLVGQDRICQSLRSERMQPAVHRVAGLLQRRFGQRPATDSMEL